jgi:DNA polymerase
MKQAQQLLDAPLAPDERNFVDYAYPSSRAVWNKIMLVGEAPGREEVRLGKPFVGRSGKLLNEMLEKAGIDRDSCFVANCFRYQPPANKIDHFFLSKRASVAQNEPIDESLDRFGSVWCKAAFASEIKVLQETVKSWKPAVILALGRTPLWALTGQNGLLTRVGQRLDCRLCQGVPVIPTFHPSFILRGNWAKQPEWLEHFSLAALLALQQGKGEKA